MNDVLTPPARVPTGRPPVRRAGPSAATLAGLEIRKTLSTRSGRAVALAAALLPPGVATMAALSGDDLGAAAMPIGIVGMVTALLLMALGVLSSAGEWTHRTVQTTFLLVPRRGRVLAAKVVALGLVGVVLAAVAVGLSMAALATLTVGDVSWVGASRAAVTGVGAGAAFAVIGAGAGAAVANAPAALTGLYLVLLGGMPVLRAAKPQIAEKLDPVDGTLALALGNGGTTQVLAIAGWVVVATVAGALLTRRRAVA
ncbi:MAG TPA: hypothetical protein VHF92_02940 [Geodermatophilus sp.]|nr:hypothetical protein [Geodermatophilus sp.]